MDKQATLSQSEWMLMEYLWVRPHTLMELVSSLSETVGWSKSTVATMVHRMEEKGVITYVMRGRTKIFSPAVTRTEVATKETKSLLLRAYNGSIGLLINTMVQSNDLSKADIDELYDILKKAEECAK